MKIMKEVSQVYARKNIRSITFLHFHVSTRTTTALPQLRHLPARQAEDNSRMYVTEKVEQYI